MDRDLAVKLINMKFKLEIRGETIGDIMDEIKDVERRLKSEIVMRTGDNTGSQDYVSTFEIREGNLSHPFVFKIPNHKK